MGDDVRQGFVISDADRDSTRLVQSSTGDVLLVLIVVKIRSRRQSCSV